MGKYFAIGPLREKHRNDMTKEEARDLAIGCLKLLFLRDCSAGDRIQIVYVTDKGTEFEEPFQLEAEWYVYITVRANTLRRFEKFIAPTSQRPIEGCQF